ncbi:15876_t:CDS:2 [Entrophospora sp. SA101]|nr:15876_t:CDS:2 [Entrophospora sp. SA101]
MKQTIYQFMKLIQVLETPDKESWKRGKPSELKGHLALKCPLANAPKISRANQAIVCFFVCCGIPFSVADSPFFRDFTKTLCNGYEPPKHTTLSNHLLDSEIANITLKIEKEVRDSKNLTLASCFQYNIFRNVSKTALSIWKNQGGVKTSSDLLLVQLSLYRNFEEPFNEIYLDELDETFNQIALSITNGNDLFGQDDNLEDVSHLDNNCDEEVINLDGVNDSHLIITESIDLNSSLLTNNNILSNEIYEENDIDHGDTNFDIDELLDNHNLINYCILFVIMELFIFLIVFMV